MSIQHLRASVGTVLMVFLGLALYCPVSAETLRIGGTGSASELMRHLGEIFSQQDGNTRIKVIQGLGSGGGITATRQGAIEIAVSARPLKPEEAASDLAELLLAHTPLAFASSHKMPNGISVADLPLLFSALKPIWTDGTPVRPILRPRSETDSALLGQLFPGLAEALETVRRRQDIPIAATDQDNASMAENIPGSLIAVAYTQLMLEQRNLRLVALDGVEPTLKNFENGTYRYGKPFYLVVRKERNLAIDSFLSFLQSDAGAQALRQAGCLPVH